MGRMRLTTVLRKGPITSSKTSANATTMPMTAVRGPRGSEAELRRLPGEQGCRYEEYDVGEERNDL